jgi:hypothetical protein
MSSIPARLDSGGARASYATNLGLGTLYRRTGNREQARAPRHRDHAVEFWLEQAQG